MENYAIIEGKIVVNAIVSDVLFAAQIGAVLLPEGYGIGDKYDGKKWTKTELPPEPMPEVPPPLPPAITTEDVLLAVAELAEKQELDKLEMQLAVAELAEISTMGGEK